MVTVGMSSNFSTSEGNRTVEATRTRLASRKTDRNQPVGSVLCLSLDEARARPVTDQKFGNKDVEDSQKGRERQTKRMRWWWSWAGSLTHFAWRRWLACRARVDGCGMNIEQWNEAGDSARREWH